jgi:hypothetical protein
LDGAFDLRANGARIHGANVTRRRAPINDADSRVAFATVRRPRKALANGAACPQRAPNLTPFDRSS